MVRAFGGNGRWPRGLAAAETARGRFITRQVGLHAARITTIAIVQVLALGGCASAAHVLARASPQARSTVTPGAAIRSAAGSVPRSATARGSGPQALLRALVRAGAPGAVALVRRDGHVRTFAAGVANVRTRQAISARLRFRVGSVSKTVVAALVLKLVAQQRLALSDTVDRWLPGLLPDGGQITLLELLQHRSGLPDYLSGLLLGQFHRPPRDMWTPRLLIGLVVNKPLDFAPGSRFEYSNTNYVVLGLIIERVTGTPLERYAQRTLFGPLRMGSSTFALGRVHGAHAHGYLLSSNRYLLAAPGGLGDTDLLNGAAYGAAASLVSTAGDLDRFFRALFTGRIIPRSLLALMEATQPAPFGHDYQRYGLGLEGSRYPCGDALGHGGAVWGYRAIVRSTPDARHLIVLLVNRDYGDLFGPINRTVSALYCGN